MTPILEALFRRVCGCEAPARDGVLYMEHRQKGVLRFRGTSCTGETVCHDTGIGYTGRVDGRETHKYCTGADTAVGGCLAELWDELNDRHVAALLPAVRGEVESVCRDRLAGDLDKLEVELVLRRQDIVVLNGVTGEAFDSRPAATTVVTVQVVAGRKTSRAQRRRGCNSLDGQVILSQLGPAIDEATAAARAKLKAIRLPTGSYPVVLCPGLGALVLHEAVTHALEADLVLDGGSMFAGRLGQQVAPPTVTVVDSALEPGQKSSYRVDDQGIQGRSTSLIVEGRLVGYMHSLGTAAAMGTRSTGNGRRESFRSPALPRATCTKLLPGLTPVPTLLGQVKRGVYVDRFAQGQTDVSGGPFQFVAVESRLIEDGDLGDVLSPVVVSGMGREFLGSIAVLGNDFAYEAGGGGPCHKIQTVDVSFGQPTVLLERLTFS